MIEAVGYNYISDFFNKASSLLKPDGLMALQGITYNDQNFNTYKNGHLLEIYIQVNKDNVIPKERKVLCQGEVKLESLSIPESNTLYREYVCSCVLKCAQDSFNVLPESSVVINVEQVSAGQSNETILSCHIEKGLLEFLLIEDDKPSEILEFFVHLEDFNPHRG